jgi:DNA-binding winged helix-turn-helix (wHTH) protein/tetratricopeptide (TPR) repeat protein
MESFEFGPFRFEAATRSLFQAGTYIALTPKVAETLLVLLEEAGRVVAKEQLFERVWPGVVVEEGGIANNISLLRKVLDGGFEEGPIATVARRGYRFTVPVRLVDGSEAAVAEAPRTSAAPAASVGATLPVVRNTILVADIDNQTGDAVFDGTIRQALALHLAQSPAFDVMTDRKVHSTLGIMGRQGAPVVGEVALEICQRTGAKAAITGSIFTLGEAYVIGLHAVNGENGGVLVTEQARAHGKGEVLAALDRAAIGLRTKLGESLASVRRFSQPFDEVATSSLDALKAYTIARGEWLERGEAAAKPHQLRAIALDPYFVSAYSALGLCCNNMGQMAEASQYMQKAYDMRSRATERERVRIETFYHDAVTGDVYKALDATRVWRNTYPDEATPDINAGSFHSLLGQWDKAAAATARAMDQEITVVVCSNLAIAQLALGRHDDARATLEMAFARGFDAFSLHLDAYQEAFLRADTEAMQRHVEAVLGREGEEDFLIAAQANTEAYHGRFVRARVLTRRAVESALRAQAAEMAAVWEAEAALREAEVGNHALAREGAAAALAISTGRRVNGMAGLAFARAGDAERALRTASDLARDFPQDTLVQRYWVPCIRAAVALGREDAKLALHELETAAGVELGLTFPLEGGLMYPAYLRGEALRMAGRSADAVKEFEKIVERPGLIKNFVLYPLALHASGHADRFREIWASADEDLARSRLAETAA